MFVLKFRYHHELEEPGAEPAAGGFGPRGDTTGRPAERRGAYGLYEKH
jgi:hypothetical protein